MSGTRFYNELNGTQLKKANVVILPLGSTEFHGEHAPAGTDSIIANQICKEVAEKVDGIVLPVVHYGYSRLHEDDPGTITIRASVLTDMLCDILCSLGKQQIKCVLIVNAHDGNTPAMTIAALEARKKYPEMLVLMTTWWEITRHDESIKELFGKYGGKGHGGGEETAVVMASGVGEVELDKAERAEMITHQGIGIPAPFLKNDFTIAFSRMQEITGKGFEGYPEEATPEKGRVILDAVVKNLAHFISELESNHWKLKA